MSTIVVVRKENQIVIGADTLTVYGSTKIKSQMVKNFSKIIKLNDTYIATCGNAVTNQVLKNYFTKLEEKPKFKSIEDIFGVANKLHKALKDEYFIRPEGDQEDDYETSQFECLIANASGIFGIDSYRYVEEYAKFYSYGSGFRYALGAMHAVYDQDHLTAEDIAKIGLEAAADFDDSTDKPFEIFKIFLK
ncbi:MAG: hypothetical protein K0Q49_125 [Haloplasmataceae bacterium]|jgi:ATP-dependent protease HslVU (ClpYQ) peptidase subunit|nr:hypothetical protein [Haloplasmataceae bacterium]